MERWADMPGFENYYEISDNGNARSKERKYHNSQGRLIIKHSKLLKPLDNSNGYVRYGLKIPDDNKVYKVLAHRMVAIAFIPNPSNLEEVGHLDDIRNHNHYSNLYWTTHRDNVIKAVDSGRLTFESVKSSNTFRTLIIDPSGKVIEFNSRGEAASYLGVTQGAISDAIKRGGRCHGHRVLTIERLSSISNDDITDDMCENTSIGAVPVILINEKTSIVCNSLNSAAKKLDRNISSVIRALHAGTKCNGYNVYLIHD